MRGTLWERFYDDWEDNRVKLHCKVFVTYLYLLEIHKGKSIWPFLLLKHERLVLFVIQTGKPIKDYSSSYIKVAMVRNVHVSSFVRFIRGKQVL